MIINGKTVALDKPVSLKSCLEGMDCDISRVAVEKNGAIVPGDLFESEMLNDGDTLEIVCFVGGG